MFIDKCLSIKLPFFFLINCSTLLKANKGRDSSVGIETAYSLEERRVGVRFLVGSRIFSSS
jgi:hypothetical protein